MLKHWKDIKWQVQNYVPYRSFMHGSWSYDGHFGTPKTANCECVFEKMWYRRFFTVHRMYMCICSVCTYTSMWVWMTLSFDFYSARLPIILWLIFLGSRELEDSHRKHRSVARLSSRPVAVFAKGPKLQRVLLHAYAFREVGDDTYRSRFNSAFNCVANVSYLATTKKRTFRN